MAIDCSPDTLAELSACFRCFTKEQVEQVKAYLLAVIAGVDTANTQALLDASTCFRCPSEGQLQQMESYLLCLAAGGFTTVCQALDGEGDPSGVQTPEFVGQLYHDTVVDEYWRSTGLTVNDWTLIA